MEENKYHVIQVRNTNYYKIVPIKGGASPKELGGLWTRPDLAESRLKSFLNKKANQDTPKKTKKVKADAKS